MHLLVHSPNCCDRSVSDKCQEPGNMHGRGPRTWVITHCQVAGLLPRLGQTWVQFPAPAPALPQSLQTFGRTKYCLSSLSSPSLSFSFYSLPPLSHCSNKLIMKIILMHVFKTAVVITQRYYGIQTGC